MKRHTIVGVLALLALLVPLAALLLSCGGGGGGSSTGGTSSGTGTGSVAVLLADGPADGYDHIYIWVTKVSLIPAAGSAAPVTVFQTNKVEDGYPGHKVDLLAYRDEDFILTVKRDVPAGKYTKIRLEISHIEAEGTDVPCDDMEIKLPSGKIDLDTQDGPFLVTQGSTLSIRLDIDANKSINLHPAGKSGKCIFRPVVFVDIEEGAPLERCPKVVSGTLKSVKFDASSEIVGFILELNGDRGTLEVSLSSATRIFNDDFVCATPEDLKSGDPVQVRGRLTNNGVFAASLVVIGQLLDVTGTVTSVPINVPPTFSFKFQPFSNQELGGEWQVTGQTCTLVLVGCDTTVDPSQIQQGMPVRIFGKAFSAGELRAATVVLRDQEVSGTILLVEEVLGWSGKRITIDESGSSVQVLVGTATPIHLEGDGTIGLDQLCVGQKVRVLLKSLTTPFEAALVRVDAVRHAGVVSKRSPGVLEVSLTEGGTGTETVYVQPNATILKSQEDDDRQELVPFTQIKAGDSIVYFGLPECQDTSKFNAYVVVIVDGQ